MFKIKITNKFIYEGKRKELCEDGYFRTYLKEYSIFNKVYFKRELTEKVEIKDEEKKGVGF